MYVHKVQKFYLTHGNIHLYLRNGASEGICVGLNLGSTFRRQVLTVRQTVQGLGGQFSQCHHHSPVRNSHNLSVHNIQIIRRHAGQFMGIL